MSKLTYKEELITPEVSAKLLATNPGNRPINRKTVSVYAERMRQGSWQLNGECLIISEEGVLLNGQHRLSGIIASGASVFMSVISGVGSYCFDTMDSGRNRNANDILGILGDITPSQAKCITPAARLDIVVSYTGSITPSSVVWGRETPDIVAKVCASDPTYIEALEYIKDVGAVNALRGVGAGMLVFFVRRALLIDRDYTQAWLPSLLTGENLPAKDSRLLVRQRATQNINPKNKKTARNHLFYMMIKSWKWGREGRAAGAMSTLSKVDSRILSTLRLPTDEYKRNA